MTAPPAPAQLAIRRARWLIGIVWFLSWFELYLELYRFHHVTVASLFGAPEVPAGFASGARPGGWLRTVMVCSAATPLVFIVLSLVTSVRRWRPRVAVGTAPDPSFPIANATIAFGLLLAALGTINQLIWQPPFGVDLTLRRGNGGFVVLGGACALGGLLLSSRKAAEDDRGGRGT